MTRKSLGTDEFAGTGLSVAERAAVRAWATDISGAAEAEEAERAADDRARALWMADESFAGREPFPPEGYAPEQYADGLSRSEYLELGWPGVGEWADAHRTECPACSGTGIIGRLSTGDGPSQCRSCRGLGDRCGQAQRCGGCELYEAESLADE